jgi:hypothetical protein
MLPKKSTKFISWTLLHINDKHYSNFIQFQAVKNCIFKFNTLKSLDNVRLYLWSDKISIKNSIWLHSLMIKNNKQTSKHLKFCWKSQSLIISSCSSNLCFQITKMNEKILSKISWSTQKKKWKFSGKSIKRGTTNKTSTLTWK